MAFSERLQRYIRTLPEQKKKFRKIIWV